MPPYDYAAGLRFLISWIIFILAGTLFIAFIVATLPGAFTLMMALIVIALIGLVFLIIREHNPQGGGYVE